MTTGLDNGQPFLDVRDLRTTFDTEAGTVTAVNGVSLRIPHGKTVAIVGESGCGKSVTALSIMRLIPDPPGRIAGGRILLAESPRGERVDLLSLDEARMRRIRGNRIAMIFQDPLVALNPVMSIGEQIVEAIELHRPLRGNAAHEAAVEMLRRVGIAAPERRVRNYPHQLSGGMCQRVMIAMALACDPALLIADEPTTALDVTIQLQILDLLCELQAKTGMSIIVITHDLAVVAQVADYVYVMYAGQVVEHAPVDALFACPLHPYTRGLLRCRPSLDCRGDNLETIPGQVPDPLRVPVGCSFHPRCRLSAERAGIAGRETVVVESAFEGVALRRCVEHCDTEPWGTPSLRECRKGHFVACWEVDAASPVSAADPSNCGSAGLSQPPGVT